MRPMHPEDRETDYLDQYTSRSLWPLLALAGLIFLILAAALIWLV